MAMSEPFFDTNVLVYLFSDEAKKAARSQDLLAAGGVISVQVLNECLTVTRRKLKKSLPEIDLFLKLVRNRCRVVPVTMDVHDCGRALLERFNLQVYDSMIIAAASLAGCETLWSEDMQDGLRIGGITIRNPYKN